jgi:hypothetical protein
MVHNGGPKRSKQHQQTAAFSGPDMQALCTWRAPHLHEFGFANDEHILVHDGVFFADIGGELVCLRARELPWPSTIMDVSHTNLEETGQMRACREAAASHLVAGIRAWEFEVVRELQGYNWFVTRCRGLGLYLSGSL